MSRSRRERIRALVEARAKFAGIGTKLAKLRLNKLAKTSVHASALRTALEIEDANLTAKRYPGGGNIGGYNYSEISYLRKAEGIEKLIALSVEQGWTYGVQTSDRRETTHVIYFDLPGV